MAYIGKSPTGTGVRSRYYFTASGSETSLSGASDSGATLLFTDGAYVDVSLNGVALVAGTDYNTATANTIGGLSALSASDIVEILVYDIFTVADTVSASSGGTFTGGVTITGSFATPNRPSFRGTKGFTTTDFTSETDITGYTEDFDIGGAFDASAGTYTVPVTGIYQINVQQDGAANTAGATNTLLKLYVAGTAGTFDLVRQDPQGGQSSSSMICQTKSLTAGQVLKVSFQVNDDTSVEANFVFSGFLIG